MPLPVTAVFAGLLALWMIYLQGRVIGFRRANGVSLGDGGHETGARLIRAHGNAAETAPIFLILLGLSEGLGAPAFVLAPLAIAFLAGRVMHGAHFLLGRRDLTFRVWGMVLTLATTVLAAIGAIGHGLAGPA